MAQWLEVLVGKPADPSLIPTTQLERARTDTGKLSSDLHTCSVAHTHVHM